MQIKDWFIIQNFNQQQAQAIRNGHDLEIIKETAKAYYLLINTDFGSIKSWVPKSVISDNKIKTENNIDFEIGQKVNHVMFGDGIVKNVDNDFVLVAFKNETKKLLKDKKYFK